MTGRLGRAGRAVVAGVLLVVLAVPVVILVRHRQPSAGPAVVAAATTSGLDVGHAVDVGVAHVSGVTVGPGPRPAAVTGVTWTSGSMEVGALRRAWWLAAPERAPHHRLPVLMVLHGRGSTPAIEAARTGFLGEVAAGAAIAVYPAGYDDSWNAGRCCGKSHADHIDDRTFLTKLASLMQSRSDVAPNDLELVGFSNGAKMAFDLVCSGAVLPRAIAVAEAVPTTDCEHAPAVPLVQVAGTADPIVPYAAVDPKLTADGVPLTPVLTEVQDWAARNNCTVRTSSADPRRQQQTWNGCAAPVALLTYPGGTHVWWPDATPYLWQFLRSHANPIT